MPGADKRARAPASAPNPPHRERFGRAPQTLWARIVQGAPSGSAAGYPSITALHGQKSGVTRGRTGARWRARKPQPVSLWTGTLAHNERGGFMTSRAPWPALEHEERLWTPAAIYFSPSGTPPRKKRYFSAVPPLIATRPVELEKKTLLAAELATQELSRLDAEMGATLTNFAPILLRSEAASSSQIEKLTASARSIFSAEAGMKTGRNAQMILSNTKALQAGADATSMLDAEHLKVMHAALTSNQKIHLAGAFRDEAVWIGTRSDSPIGADFVAPHHSLVPGLLDDLMSFAERGDVPSLVSVAITHAQFETIHPFTDGNGRVGRALAQVMLKQRGVLRNTFVPVSAGLLADVNGYHGALTAYREGNPDRVVKVFADASVRAVQNTRQLRSELEQVLGSWTKQLGARTDSHAWRLLDFATETPVFSAAAAAEALGVKPPNIYPALNAATQAGLLVKEHEHRLGSFWRAPDVLNALDRFAQRAGRRELP